MSSILTERKDDKVTPEDHAKCEQAFKDANVGILSDNQKQSIYQFESNLIKMAKKGNEDGIVATARDDVSLPGGAPMRLATELSDQFERGMQIQHKCKKNTQNRNILFCFLFFLSPPLSYFLFFFSQFDLCQILVD